MHAGRRTTLASVPQISSILVFLDFDLICIVSGGWGGTHLPLHSCGGQRITLGSWFCPSVLYSGVRTQVIKQNRACTQSPPDHAGPNTCFFATGSLIGLELTKEVRTASPRDALSRTTPTSATSQHWDCNHTPPYLVFVCCHGGPNSGPQAFEASVFMTDLSSQTNSVLFFLKLFHIYLSGGREKHPCHDVQVEVKGQLVVKNTGYSLRGPWFNSPHLRDRSQAS